MKPTAFPNIEIVSDQACLLRFCSDINETTSNYIAHTAQQLTSLNGIIDLVPSYTTLLVVFNDDIYDRFLICKTIIEAIKPIDVNNLSTQQTRKISIPVYYAKDVGPDIDEVAAHCNLSREMIIKRHSETTYRAYALGFSPGFAFLGNTPSELYIPRKATPRLNVPVGSVALAENQTAVYPSKTPGGWQIIGRTPLQLVDWESDNLSLIAMGDRVTFKPISKDEFLALGGQLDGF